MIEILARGGHHFASGVEGAIVTLEIDQNSGRDYC
jgi:hypothetical protein